MQFLCIGKMLESVPNNPLFWTTVLVVTITIYAVRYFYVLSKYPPGPKPLPVFGNLIALSKYEDPIYKIALKLSKEYGDPFTIWMGSNPYVMVSSLEGIAELSGPKRNDFAGRPQLNFTRLQLKGISESPALSDFNPAWEALRKVAHLAVKKYAATEHLSTLCADVCDQFVETNCKTRTEMLITAIIEPIMLNVIATSAFGDTYDPNGALSKYFLRTNELFAEAAPNGLPSDMAPILKYVFFRQERNFAKLFTGLLEIIEKLYDEARVEYQSGETRHFIDAIVAAKEEAEAKEQNIAKYLTEDNMKQIIGDLYFAGEGTSRIILKWALIHLANDPQLQKKLRTIIVNRIGDRRPVYKDMTTTLPEIFAFIQECLRLYPAIPIGLPHKTTKDTSVCGQKIPQNTVLLINLYAYNRNSKVYSEPNTFQAERFLQRAVDGSKTINHISFGVGPRSCLGEKMGQADMFYILVRLLQRCRFSLPKGPGSADFQSIYSAIVLECKPQMIVIEPF